MVSGGDRLEWDIAKGSGKLVKDLLEMGGVYWKLEKKVFSFKKGKKCRSKVEWELLLLFELYIVG